MNTKRQTVWLVSMLSIMVVLSAYYLFTNETPEDLASINPDDMLGHHIVLDHDEIDITDYDLSDDVVYLDDLDSAEYADLDQILREVQAQQTSTDSMFNSLHLQREEDLKDEMEKLYAVAASGSIEEQTDAQEKMFELSDKWTKLSHLEDVIRRDYPNAIIKEEDSQWKVMINADHMDKSQAVSIMTMVMKEMGASTDKVVVEVTP